MQCPIDRASHIQSLMTLLGAQGDKSYTAGDQNPKIVFVVPQLLVDPAPTGK